MENFYSLFFKYVDPSEENAYCLEISSGKDTIRLSELLFLYRQARIYNIESELGLPSSPERRERVLNFFERLGLNSGGEQLFKMFKYEKEKDTFDNGGFISFYIFYTYKHKNLLELFFKEAIKLFDTESMIKFCVTYVTMAKERKLAVPYCITSLLEKLPCELIDKDVVSYAIGNKAEENVDETKLLFRYLNAFYINSYFTTKSKSFLVLADELYSNLKKSTFADYSVVSLQYYKVIETELKEKLIKKATNEIKSGRLYVGKKYFKMKDFDYSTMALGEISSVLEDAINYLDNGHSCFNECEYSINTDVYENLFKICQKKIGFLEFYKDITSTPFRQMFRNPPAHTEPLPERYIPAVEAIFKCFVSNIGNIQQNCNEVITTEAIKEIIEHYQKQQN